MYKTKDSFYFFLQRLPPEKVTPEALRKVEKQNQEIFNSLKETMKSDEPIWKMESKINQKMKDLPHQR